MANARWASSTMNARWHRALKNAAARRKSSLAGRTKIIAARAIRQHIYGAQCPICLSVNRFLPSGNLIDWCDHIQEADLTKAVFVMP